MAMTARAEQATAFRTRVHGGEPSVRAMVKATAPVAHVAPRPALVVIPTRRRAARLVAFVSSVLFILMLGAAAFQTQLARRQLTLDTMDRRISVAHAQYESLRRERAELRSPGRLVREAAKLGMAPASRTEFVAIDPDVVATVQRTGVPAAKGAATIDQQFSDYAKVKAQAGGSP
jgi:hypothetical protein